VVFVDDAIYILAKDGTIYHCDVYLKILHSMKFPFAHFVGVIYGEFIYAIEREGYVIATDPILSVDNVFELPDRIDKWLYTTSDAMYYDRYYFKLHVDEEEMNEPTEEPTDTAAETRNGLEGSEAGAEKGAEEEEGHTIDEIWQSISNLFSSDDGNETKRSDDRE
jgi:hypothetical protein